MSSKREKKTIKIEVFEKFNVPLCDTRVCIRFSSIFMLFLPHSSFRRRSHFSSLSCCVIPISVRTEEVHRMQRDEAKRKKLFLKQS